MGGRNLFLGLTAAVPLAAALLWALAWMLKQPPEETKSVCVPAVWEDSIPLTGQVERREQPLFCTRERVFLLARPGERLPAGAPAAIGYDEPVQLFRASLLLRLRREEGGSPASLTAALARGDAPAAALAADSLSFSDRREQVGREKAALILAGAEEALLSAPRSGVFLPGAGPEGAFGALITEPLWSFRADLPKEAEPRLSQGRAVTLRLPDRELAAARVLWRGETSLTLTCREHPEAVLGLGGCTLTVIFGESRGLCLPESAIREGEEGFYVLRAGTPIRTQVPVTVLRRREGLALVTSPGLREGMEVLLPG